MRRSCGISAALLVGTWCGCEPLEPQDDDAGAEPSASNPGSKPGDATHDPPEEGADDAHDAGAAHDAASAREAGSADDAASAHDSGGGRGDAGRDCRYFDASVDATVGTEDCTAPTFSCTSFDAAVDATVTFPDCSTTVFHDSGHNDQLDPGTIARVDCGSTHRSSDVTLALKQTTLWENKFEVAVHQTFPTAVDRTFTEVYGSWSGHFFNFNDVTSLAPLKFHLLTRGMPNDSDNVEVYTDDSNTGEVSAHQLNCTLQRNP